MNFDVWDPYTHDVKIVVGSVKHQMRRSIDYVNRAQTLTQLRESGERCAELR